MLTEHASPMSISQTEQKFMGRLQKVEDYMGRLQNRISNVTKIRTAVMGSATGLHNPCLHKLMLWEEQGEDKHI